MGKIYIRSMDKKPDHCAECPICNGDDDCDLLPKWYDSWESQYADCPLEEEPETHDKRTNTHECVKSTLEQFRADAPQTDCPWK